MVFPLRRRVPKALRDGTEATYSQTWTRERLAVDHAVWETELKSACAYLILEELLDRLHELELHVFRKTAHVVV